MEQQHKRRVRYKGTHPRSFHEKYKELNPEKYQDTIAHVIEKGGTPAGMHIPIMVPEILDFLQIQPGDRGLDATLGYGGHTAKMLECLQGQGHICALDVDPVEMEKTRARLAAMGYGADNLCSQISAYLPCRLTTRSAALPTNTTDRSTCGLTRRGGLPPPKDSGS